MHNGGECKMINWLNDILNLEILHKNFTYLIPDFEHINYHNSFVIVFVIWFSL